MQNLKFQSIIRYKYMSTRATRPVNTKKYLSRGGKTLTRGGGTLRRGGGTLRRGGGTPFHPVPAEFNHCKKFNQKLQKLTLNKIGH